MGDEPLLEEEHDATALFLEETPNAAIFSSSPRGSNTHIIVSHRQVSGCRSPKKACGMKRRYIFGGLCESRRDLGWEKRMGSDVEINFSLLEELGGAERNSHGENQSCSLYRRGRKKAREVSSTRRKTMGI